MRDSPGRPRRDVGEWRHATILRAAHRCQPVASVLCVPVLPCVSQRKTRITTRYVQARTDYSVAAERRQANANLRNQQLMHVRNALSCPWHVLARRVRLTSTPVEIVDIDRRGGGNAATTVAVPEPQRAAVLTINAELRHLYAAAIADRQCSAASI